MITSPAEKLYQEYWEKYSAPESKFYSALIEEIGKLYSSLLDKFYDV